MRRTLLALSLIVANAGAAALDFRSVGVDAAVLYDAPSAQAKKLYILGRYYPVEVIVTLDKWLKVRDASGTLSWIEAASLANRRSVLVTASQADVRAKPDAQAPLVFQAERDVALELLAIDGAWLKVRHRDGLSGYLAAKDAWGI